MLYEVITRFLHSDWKDFKFAEPDDFEKHFPNGVDKQLLLELGEKICSLPSDEKFINKTYKLVADRRQMLQDNRLDWAMGELLAYATLVYEDFPVRLSGQDSVRGTFAHRHASHIIEKTDKTYTPIKYLKEHQAPFHVYNSPLNEYGVLGFEYGRITSYNVCYTKLLRVKRNVYIGLEKILAKITSYIVVSEGERKEIIKNKIISERQILNINNAIDFNEYIHTSEIKDIRSTYDIPEGKFIVGSVGRLAPQKDWETFIFAASEVLKSHPETIFLITGDGELRNELLKLIFASYNFV